MISSSLIQRPLKEPSQKVMLFLSFTMLCFAIIVALPKSEEVNDLFPLYSDKTPMLTTYRDETQGGKMFAQNRVKEAPGLYLGLHIVPAIIWSLLIPTQHLQSIRKNYIQFHRISGWLIGLSAIALSISGSLFPLYNLSYSDPDLFHVHKLPIPGSNFYFPFPTFNLQIKVLPLFMLFPLYKAIRAVRVEKNIQNHKHWMIVHTIGGYLISVQRVAMLVNGIIGWTIHFLPKEVKAQMAEAFNFPDGSDRAKVWEIERSAFALTAWAAFITYISMVGDAGEERRWQEGKNWERVVSLWNLKAISETYNSNFSKRGVRSRDSNVAQGSCLSMSD